MIPVHFAYAIYKKCKDNHNPQSGRVILFLLCGGVREGGNFCSDFGKSGFFGEDHVCGWVENQVGVANIALIALIVHNCILPYLHERLPFGGMGWISR